MITNRVGAESAPTFKPNRIIMSNLLHFGTYNPYDDDDDDDIYSSNQENDYEENDFINPQKQEKMKDWEKPNWFITLCDDDKQRNYINIANVTDISFGKEEAKMKWNKKLHKKVEVVPKDFSPEEWRTLESMGEITTETRHYLCITTTAKTYKCQIRKEEVIRYSDWLAHNNMMELYLKPILCKKVEIWE